MGVAGQKGWETLLYALFNLKLYNDISVHNYTCSNWKSTLTAWLDSQRYGIKNEAAIDLQSESNVTLIAALFLFRIVVWFEEIANRLDRNTF